jgi:hypothetical protein
MEAVSSAANTSGKRSPSGLKERSSHVKDANAVGVPARRQSTLAIIGGRLRTWLSGRNQTNSMSTMIPSGLSAAERLQYETLIKVVETRLACGIKAPRVVVITDLAKDYDDLAAMVVLKELNRLGVVNLLGFVANLMPAKRRAEFGRGALDLLDLQHIPIAKGTSGFPDGTGKKHNVFDYEFDCKFMAPEDDQRLVDEGDGEKLLHRLCSDAAEKGEKLTLVLISSLEDIHTFSLKYRQLLVDAVANVVLQGGYSISESGLLIPDEAAANNRYDIQAAKAFHTFLQESNIPSTVYTKVAAFATPLTSELFHELARTKHPLGEHLRKVQLSQDLAFYISASKEDPKERFAPFMDQKWFLKNKTSWFDEVHPPNTPYPIGDQVIPYLDKVVVYDALAALGSSGPDALDALKVLTDGTVEPPTTHRVVGFAGPPSDPGIHPEQMATVLAALLKGSLMSCESVKAMK